MSLYEMSPAQPILSDSCCNLFDEEEEVVNILPQTSQNILVLADNNSNDGDDGTSIINEDPKIIVVNMTEEEPSKPVQTTNGSNSMSTVHTSRKSSKGRCRKTQSKAPPRPTKKVIKNDQNNHCCPVCGKNFVSSSKLASHEKTHVKARPFSCKECGRSFTVRYSLICHVRTHTRERPYACSVCGSRFSQASSLKTHQIYKHTKEFPYACLVCGRGFISPGQQVEHASKSHCGQRGTTVVSNGESTSSGKGKKE